MWINTQFDQFALTASVSLSLSVSLERVKAERTVISDLGYQCEGRKAVHHTVVYQLQDSKLYRALQTLIQHALSPLLYQAIHTWHKKY